MTRQYMIFLLISIIVIVCILGSVVVKDKYTGEGFATSPDVKPQSNATPWNCEKVQNWGATSYQDGYVIARKSSNGTPQCWNIENSKTEHTKTCTVYDDPDTCKLALMTSEKTPISTCTKDASSLQQHVCKQLNETVWQCHLTDKNNNIYSALRKNEDKDIECLGNSQDSCLPFASLMSCMETVPTVRNTKYLACGKMMYQLFGMDGYSYPEHYCAKFKNIIS